MGRRCDDPPSKSDGQIPERGSMNNSPPPTIHITQQQLESYLWGADTLLRGVIDAGDYKQFIFPLLFFKRICDVYDEEYQQALENQGRLRLCRLRGKPPVMATWHVRSLKRENLKIKARQELLL